MVPHRTEVGDLMDIKQVDASLYVLNAQGTNRWWTHVQPGSDDQGNRISDDECRRIATTLATDRVARQEAQRELERYKGLLAKARLDLMRELKEQGWTAPGAPATDSLRDKILDDLHGLFDTEMITENDSGDELIRLTGAIAVVEAHFEAAPQVEVPNTFKRPNESDDEWIDRITGAAGR